MTAAAFSPSPFRPAGWLRGAHAQTIGGRFLRRLPPVSLRRERVELPDGDFVDLDFADAPRSADRAPLVVVLHGLEGSSRSAYVLHTLAALRSRGLSAVAVNFRSCGGEMNRLPRFYHAGDTADLAHLLAALRDRAAGVPLGAIGFSLGGNVLLKHLGERGGEEWSLLRAAVAISVPFDLAAGAARLEGGMGRVYSSYFMRKLLRKTAAKAERLRELCDLDRVRRARTLREFDDAATAPLHGFAGADEYYRSCSSARFLGAVRVPTLLIHAEDDPFLPAAAVPRDAISANPALVDAVVPRGGHVGFVAGPPWAPVFWAEQEAARFLAGHLVPRD